MTDCLLAPGWEVLYKRYRTGVLVQAIILGRAWGVVFVPGFENPLYLSGDLMADSAVPSDLSVPKVPEPDRAATSARAKGYSLFVLQEHGGKPKGSFPLHHLVSDSAW
eukprot:CAMPEP_0174381636 /NCGR_PEP_ID=MMETSP0811_2-20130205/124145_1 /TAXON_ID=73025 ORGANISM="Eutreptiella gymnastica-like, Strain CCMP1594" /NCGR_SAMPLE_ID=MMETSP0811_2 /ASSEMBLY_ACC=CAM_ASM_000667 /LENGTH=107 /DNA_ID=CAMNT_0015534847 /DNA_START=516 /DNA_END=837 /DNA_ORIENTATION=-